MIDEEKFKKDMLEKRKQRLQSGPVKNPDSVEAVPFDHEKAWAEKTVKTGAFPK